MRPVLHELPRIFTAIVVYNQQLGVFEVLIQPESVDALAFTILDLNPDSE